MEGEVKAFPNKIAAMERGLVNQDYHHFNRMTMIYNLAPRIERYWMHG
jgi:hypothetical protein